MDTSKEKPLYNDAWTRLMKRLRPHVLPGRSKYKPHQGKRECERRRIGGYAGKSGEFK